jgi:hypothetical protein
VMFMWLGPKPRGTTEPGSAAMRYPAAAGV